MIIGVELIVNEAKKRGMDFEWLVEPYCYKLSYKGRDEYFEVRCLSSQGLVPFQICSNKDRFKKLLHSKNLPVAKGESFKIREKEKALEFAKNIGWPVVVKPHNESHGRGVKLSIDNETGFNEVWDELSSKHKIIIVEKMYFGDEYRIFVTCNKVISVLHRVPANVTGDGEHTISELVEMKNNDQKRNSCRSMKKIVLDNEVTRKLEEDNLTLESIPEKGKYVQLRYASNIALGGDSVDVTDEVHPSVLDIAVKTVQAIPGLKYGGMDFMTQDIKADQSTVEHAIIELNKSPEIEINHFPLHGQSRDCAKAIIDLAFPESVVEDN